MRDVGGRTVCAGSHTLSQRPPHVHARGPRSQNHASWAWPVRARKSTVCTHQTRPAKHSTPMIMTALARKFRTSSRNIHAQLLESPPPRARGPGRLILARDLTVITWCLHELTKGVQGEGEWPVTARDRGRIAAVVRGNGAPVQGGGLGRVRAVLHHLPS